MTPKLTDEQQQALEKRGGAPLYLVDATNHRYVLIRAEHFEQFQYLFGDSSEETDVRALYPLVEQSFGRAGWNDPEMDDYNDYDAHRPES